MKSLHRIIFGFLRPCIPAPPKYIFLAIFELGTMTLPTFRSGHPSSADMIVPDVENKGTQYRLQKL